MKKRKYGKDKFKCWCGRTIFITVPKKRKDYLKLFVKYAFDEEIRFSVSEGGYVYFPLDDNFSGHQLGSKAAYNWLVKEHEKIK